MNFAERLGTLIRLLCGAFLCGSLGVIALLTIIAILARFLDEVLDEDISLSGAFFVLIVPSIFIMAYAGCAYAFFSLRYAVRLLRGRGFGPPNV